MTLRFASSVVLPAGLLLACLAPPCAAQEMKEEEKPLTYDDDVLPILRANCIGCHNNDKQSGGLNMVQFAALMQGGGSGEVVSAGDGEYSYLYMLAAHEAEPKMPPNGAKMAAADLATLKKWIDTGARENAGSKVKIKPKEDLSLGAAPTGRPEGPPPMPPNPYEAAAYETDGPTPMSVEAIPVEGRSPNARADAVVALAASPWAPLVAVGGERQITLFHAETLQPLGVLPFPEGRPNSLKFSTNGRLLVAGGGRGAYRGLAVVWDVTTGERVAEVGEESDAVLSADLSPDQSTVVIGTTVKRAKAYSIATGELLYTIEKPTDWVLSVAFSPDGALLAVGDRSGNLSLWEARSGLMYEDLRGHQDAIADLSWRADSNLLASGSLDGTVHLWNPRDGSVVRKIDAKAQGVEAVAFAADGTFVTAGRSGEAALWDLNGKKLRSFAKRPDYALSAAVADEAVPGEGDKPTPRIFVGDWTGAVAVFAPSGDELVAEFSPALAPLTERIAAAEVVAQEQIAAAEVVLKRQRNAAAALKRAEATKKKTAEQVAALEQEQKTTAASQKELSQELVQATKLLAQAQEASGDAADAAEQAKAEQMQAAAELKVAQQNAAETAKKAEAAVAAAKEAAKAANAVGDMDGEADAIVDQVRKLVDQAVEKAKAAADEATAAAEQAKAAAAKADEVARDAAKEMNAADAKAKELTAELAKVDERLKQLPQSMNDAKQAAAEAAKAVEPAAKAHQEAQALEDPTPARDAAVARLEALRFVADQAAAAAQNDDEADGED